MTGLKLELLRVFFNLDQDNSPVPNPSLFMLMLVLKAFENLIIITVCKQNGQIESRKEHCEMRKNINHSSREVKLNKLKSMTRDLAQIIKENDTRSRYTC